MSTTIKAVRGKICLGSEIVINVYRLPDATYRLAGRNVTDAVEEPANSLLREMGVKSLKALPGADLSLLQVKADSGEFFIPVSIEDAVDYWIEISAGNKKAKAIIKALAMETLERRADREFNVIVPESVRDQKLENRVLEFACPGEPVFQDEFEDHVCRITGLHKHDIRTGKFYWEFVYCWLTAEERARLEEINPVLSNGRRKHKIHDCLTPETKERLKPLQLKLISKMESCNTVSELRRMVKRSYGIDQPSLFDGFDFDQSA